MLDQKLFDKYKTHSNAYYLKKEKSNSVRPFMPAAKSGKFLRSSKGCVAANFREAASNSRIWSVQFRPCWVEAKARVELK